MPSCTLQRLLTTMYVWQLYVDTYFPEANKEAAKEMLGQIRDRFRDDLETVPWMDDSTRPKAIHKLDEMVFEVCVCLHEFMCVKRVNHKGHAQAGQVGLRHRGCMYVVHGKQA
jgi:predicted metalloendopeptidase